MSDHPLSTTWEEKQEHEVNGHGHEEEGDEEGEGDDHEQEQEQGQGGEEEEGGVDPEFKALAHKEGSTRVKSKHNSRRAVRLSHDASLSFLSGGAQPGRRGHHASGSGFTPGATPPDAPRAGSARSANFGRRYTTSITTTNRVMNMVANLNNSQGSPTQTHAQSPPPNLSQEIKQHNGLSPATNSTATPRRRHNTWLNAESAPPPVAAAAASPPAEQPDTPPTPSSDTTTSPSSTSSLSSSTETPPPSTGNGTTNGSGNGNSNGNAHGDGGGSSRKFFSLKRSQAAQASQVDLNSEYDNYLAIAKKEVFNDVAPLNFLYQAGKDQHGRTVIAMIGSHLPAKKIDLERVMLYAISVMDPVVESEYVLVYTHTNMSAENRPNFAWLRKMYTIFNRKYKKNLKQLYIVHPTVWIKMTLRLFKPFLSNKFWKKLVYIDHSADLWKHFQKEDIKLPDSVLNYGAPPRKKQPIFGTSLDEVVARPENNLHNGGETRDIPKIVDDAVMYLRQRALKTEGVFRLSGSNAQIKELKKSFDNGEDVDLSEVEDPHVVAGLLKLYLRELPTPVLVNCHESLLNCHLLQNQQQQIDCLKMIVASLPRVHKATAKHLLAFFFDVTQYAGENKMTPVNLSIVTAPNLVKNPHETMESAIQDTPAINSAVSILIQYADQIL